MSNTPRFRRVEPRIHRHVRSGELWFVGRQEGRVKWQRLRTPDLRVARATVAMLGSNIYGNTAVFLVVDGKEQYLPEPTPVIPEKPLPRMRQVLAPADMPAPQALEAPAVARVAAGPTPALDDFLRRWRRGKSGLKAGTEARLDHHLTMLRRYVATQRPVTDYKPQDIRDYLAKARADKVKGRRRLKEQTINEAIWRPLQDAFALAVEENFIPRNPMDSVKREKAEPINRKQHAWDDAERILEGVKARAYESYLELKFILFMGVGQAEAKDFTGGSVDGQKQEITFIRRKTGKQFTVPIFPWAREFIHAETEPRLKRGQPVFDWRNPRKALDAACRNLGLTLVEIRSLRRTLIIHLIEQGIDIRTIAKWQGHADARLILSRYGAHIDASHEKRELDRLGGTAG